ncbi:hypothetical protein A2954_07505 [Candidatus Roizmanbacteria bacterium RIFCSPLOWO2_01_FULL_37_12]|uniref:Polyprenyl synthetase n=1 Tax=Candidatus Roizmanbacteria bacterium RIFCSPLOWO2_01_FULL_37_12 TaxID=1802056 RepID=A0A1F7IEB3_9BACT|nr:MAG: hypothetical protein A2954_07505 [Candidatus Roizmanbacteria bacterium RIFCSPLOWO2_01_FULL_37_12]
MKDNLVLSYLENYSKKTIPLFNYFFNAKKNEARKIGANPYDLLKQFIKTAILGKKIRGALMVLGFEIAGGKKLEAIYDASLFIELMHSGLLIHDDVMDNTDLRRGHPSLHKQYSPEHLGKSMAINAGDLAFYLSWEKLMNSNFPTERLILAGKIYSEFLTRVIYGQILDIVPDNNKTISKTNILSKLRYKTAEYTGVFPLLVGAILGGMKDEKKLRLLKEYGLALGWAFQIQDDVLGLYGDKEKTGKPVGSDLKEGKKTLFVYYLLKHGNAKQKSFILSILGNKNVNSQDVNKAQKLFKEIGAYDYVIKLGWDYVKNGKKAVPAITSDKKLQKILTSFIVFMMERTR